MSDIVERLRDYPNWNEHVSLEAADTIERLRITVNDQAATITKLFEEVVKLQERLMITSDRDI